MCIQVATFRNVCEISELCSGIRRGERDGSLQSAICCSNRPNIGSGGCSSTDTFAFMFLQNTQETILCLNCALKCGLAKGLPFANGCDGSGHGHPGRPQRAVYRWTGLTCDQYCPLPHVRVPASLAALIT